MGKEQLAAKIPVYEDGQVSFDKLGSLLQVSNDDIAKIIEVSPTTVRTKGQISQKTLEKTQPLLYILNMLWTILDGNVKEMRRWLNEPRVEWMGLTPLAALKMGKTKAVKDFLERNLEGEISGS